MQPTVLKIDLQRCINCSLCRRACPTEAINYFSTGHRTHVIEPKLCIGCDICVKVCPVDCIDEDVDYVIDPAQLALARDKARAFAKRQHGIKLQRQQRTVAAIGAVSRRDVASAELVLSEAEGSGPPQADASSIQHPASSLQNRRA